MNQKRQTVSNPIFSSKPYRQSIILIGLQFKNQHLNFKVCICIYISFYSEIFQKFYNNNRGNFLYKSIYDYFHRLFIFYFFK